MLLTERQRQIFQLVMEGHIVNGEPIASDWLVARLPARVSAATVRNDLLELENRNLLRQPHTSAGRVPTEKGYRYYIKNCVRPPDCQTELDAIEDVLVQTAESERWRRAARELAVATNNAVFIGLSDGSVFVTGWARLLTAPEAHDLTTLQQLIGVIEQPDDLLNELRSVMNDDVQILLGRQNPIDARCALLFTRCQDEAGEYPVAMCGFLRMRYDRNIAFLRAIKNLLTV